MMTPTTRYRHSSNLITMWNLSFLKFQPCLIIHFAPALYSLLSVLLLTICIRYISPILFPRCIL